MQAPPPAVERRAPTARAMASTKKQKTSHDGDGDDAGAIIAADVYANVAAAAEEYKRRDALRPRRGLPPVRGRVAARGAG